MSGTTARSSSSKRFVRTGERKVSTCLLSDSSDSEDEKKDGGEVRGEVREVGIRKNYSPALITAKKKMNDGIEGDLIGEVENISNFDQMASLPYYHGSITSDDAEERLRSQGKEGGYLLRESDKRCDFFILSTFSKGSVTHTVIPRSEAVAGRRNIRQTFAEAIVVVEDIVYSSDDYCYPLKFDPIIHESLDEEKVFKKFDRRFCYCCNYTGSKFKVDNHLKTHKIKKCFNCGQYLKTLNYHFHVIRCVKTPEHYNCDLCNFSTIWKSSFKKHRKIHCKKQYTCRICNIIYEDEEKFRLHQCYSDFKCKVCNKDFLSWYSLKRHMKTKENVSLGCKPKKRRIVYKCDKCPFENRYMHRLETHKNHKHAERKPKIYNCEFCEYATRKLSSIKGHRGACKKGANNPTIISIIGDATICMT